MAENSLPCSSCGSAEQRIFTPRAGLQYRICDACGNCEQVLAPTTDNNAFESAQNKYYGDDSMLLTAAPNPLEHEIIAKRQTVLMQHLPQANKVLEVGPGSGHILKWLLERGQSVTAVEHAPSLARQLEATYAAPVLCGEFEKMSLESNSFDAFCSFHVIEHVLDPLAHLQAAFNAVRPGGLAFIATPNARSLQQLALPKLSPNFDSAHTFLFSPASLTHYCEKAGWKVKETLTPEYTAGWLRVATKILRRVRGQDEEATAGQYAGGSSGRLGLVMRLLSLTTFPLRVIQAAAGYGNEIFLVLEKPK
jgi:2-polyprenyl-3-methyl-5-hydroxy-6-metoxy-1,4-benzoquinol methylase